MNTFFRRNSNYQILTYNKRTHELTVKTKNNVI